MHYAVTVEKKWFCELVSLDYVYCFSARNAPGVGVLLPCWISHSLKPHSLCLLSSSFLLSRYGVPCSWPSILVWRCIICLIRESIWSQWSLIWGEIASFAHAGTNFCRRYSSQESCTACQPSNPLDSLVVKLCMPFVQHSSFSAKSLQLCHVWLN